MKHPMFKSGLLFSLTVFSFMQLASPAFANNWSGKESIDKKVAHLKKELKLTDDQASQVKGIFEDFKTKMEALHKEKTDRISALLTPAQRSEFEEEMNERKEKHGDKDDKDGDKD